MAGYTWDCDEEVSVEDLLNITNPAIAVADTVRTTASTLLRFLRRPLRYVTMELPPHFGYLEPGDWVWVNHDLMPEPPQGYETWRLIPLYVLEVHDPLSEAKITIRGVDLRDVWAGFWSPLQTEIGMTPDLNGIAMLNRGGDNDDKGQTLRCEREQVAYGVRPPGDDAWQEVVANKPVIDSFGLRVEGGDDVNRLLNSAFSEGSGTTFTSWSYTSSGGAFIAEWTLYTLIDANGFRRTPQLVTQGAGEASYLSQTVNNMENKELAVKVYYKDGGAVDRMGLRISRSDTGEYLDSAGAWQGSVQTIAITPGSGVIETKLFVTPSFDTTSGGTVNLTIAVGHFSAAYSGYQISQPQGVELVEGLRYSYAYRSPLPTKDAAVTREAHRAYIANSPTAIESLSPIRGFVKMTVRPEWSHSILADADLKHLWSAEFDGGADTEYLRCYYERVDASNGTWHFENGDGEEATLDVSGGSLPVAGTDYVVICRWTSESENEHDLEGQALDIWVDGVRGTPAEGATTQAETSGDRNVYLGNTATLDDSFLDGHIKNLTIGRHCPSQAELLRL